MSDESSKPPQPTSWSLRSPRCPLWPPRTLRRPPQSGPPVGIPFAVLALSLRSLCYLVDIPFRLSSHIGPSAPPPLVPRPRLGKHSFPHPLQPQSDQHPYDHPCRWFLRSPLLFTRKERVPLLLPYPGSKSRLQTNVRSLLRGTQPATNIHTCISRANKYSLLFPPY